MGYLALIEVTAMYITQLLKIVELEQFLEVDGKNCRQTIVKTKM